MKNALAMAGLYAALALLYALARIYGGYGIWFLFGAGSLLVAYETLVLAALPRRFTVRRELSAERAQAGDDVRVTLRIGMPGRRLLPVRWLRVEDALPKRLAVRVDRPVWLAYPQRARETAVVYELRCVPRGVYALSDITVSCGDMFGLVTRRRRLPAPAPLTVHPAAAALAALPGALRTETGARVLPARAADDAERVIGVRDYVPGDRLSRIHWPATARTGQLRSKEFECAAGRELVLAIDAAQAAFRDDARAFELALSTLATFARCAYRDGLAFGFYALAKREWELPMARGDTALIRTLAALAALSPGGPETLPSSPWRLLKFPREATVILAARGVDAQWTRCAVIAQERRLRVHLFAITADDPPAPEEREAAEQMRRFGWQVHFVRTLASLEALAQGGVGHALRA